MAKLTFPIARRYDTKFLLSGEVTVKDFDIEFIETGAMPWPYFTDMVTDISYDMAEQAFSHYLTALDRGKPLTAIPVFNSRFFPQMGTRIRKGGPIKEPRDLIGRKMAGYGWCSNPCVWIKGILTHQYDVPFERVTWVEDETNPFFMMLDSPRAERFQIEKIGGFKQSSPEDVFGRGLTLLEDDRIDALVAAGGGAALTAVSDMLFADTEAEIRKYVEATSVFPINTVITMKREVAEANPDLAPRLLEAFGEAKRLYNKEVADGVEADHMGLRNDFLKELGLAALEHGYAPDLNRRAVDMMLAYCFEQGVTGRLLGAEDIFVHL